MNTLIAYCGIDCEKCDARIATVNNDQELKEKTAKLWSEYNNAEITADMISCDGCRAGGRRTVFCTTMCKICKCAEEKGYETCGDCKELDACEKMKEIIESAPGVLNNLKK